ncbi:MAG: nickel transporter [Halomonas sp.]|nr:nickel transporter [Halomonas sp.]|tara:strand:+ start:2221 stop:2979 length:759 start_codon:yes stop_codon:yes gene_type:complete
MNNTLPALATALLMPLADSAMAEDTLRFGVDVPTAPMEYRLPNGELTGFDIDLGNALCDHLSLECEWIVQEWSGIIPGLLSRKYDAIMSSMTINESRRETVLFSDPYIKPYSAWFGGVDLELDKVDSETLAGRTIGVQRGTLQDSYVTDTFGSVADINRYSTTSDMIMDIKTGRVDLIFLDHPAGVATLLNDSDEYRVVGELVNEPVKYFGEGFGIAFRQRDEALADKFNLALSELRQDGTYEAIYDQYFPR